MRLRHKLLLLLLGVSLLPILLLRLSGERMVRQLALSLGAQSESTLLDLTRQELRRLVEDHARVLDRERRLLDAAVGLQAMEIALALARPAHADPDGPADLRTLLAGPGMHRGQDGDGPVDYARPSLGLFGQASWPAVQDDAARLAGLVPRFRALASQTAGLAMRQETLLASGLYAVYPGRIGLPGNYDPVAAQWAVRAMESDGPVWTGPAPCPLTRQYALAVSAPVKALEGPGAGRTLGATAMVVPTTLLTHGVEHLRRVSPRAVSYLVRLPEDGRPSLAVLSQVRADEDHGPAAQPAELTSGDREPLLALMEDLRCGEAGLRELEHDGEAGLWAYAPVGELGSALVLVLPMADVLRGPQEVHQQLVARIFAELDRTKLLVVLTLAGVTLTSVLGAGRMTRDLRRLIEANRRLAQGDFGVRVDIRSRDELGELGQAFDATVPALKERLDIRRSLDLAREIQQGLLPAAAPRIRGLDVAARSLFCEAVGGDCHDFLDCCCGNRGLVAVVGDVSGHGISAALLMASARAYLRARLNDSASLAQAVGEVNALLSADTGATGNFMTLFVLALCEETGVAWVRAGHDPALCFDPVRDGFEELGGDGPALGLLPEYEFTQYARPALAPGQFFCLATDGLWEARDAAGAFYGKERLRNVLRAGAALGAEALVEAVLDDLRAFLDGRQLEDDVTVVVIKALEPENLSRR